MKTNKLGASATPLHTSQQVAEGPAVTSGAQVGILPAGPMAPRPAGQLNLPSPNQVDHKPLDAEQLKMVAGVGGVDIRGPGTLTGIISMASVREVNFGIATQVDKPVLITANQGRDNQVHFVLDMSASEALGLAGQKVSITGQINKETAQVGKITGANLAKVGGFPSGTYARVTGRIEDRNLVAIGGEAPPSGHWLVLDQPIKVASREFNELFVGRAQVEDGAHVDLNGRLDLGSYGGVETRKGSYVELTGISNVGAGEPLFDGRTYTSSASGKELDVLAWTRPFIADVPATIWVLDPGQDKAFVGSSGGFIPPNMNPFHGFRGQVSMVPPTAADERAVKWQGDKPVDSATGKELNLVHQDEMPGGVADGMGSSWYINADTQTLYRFLEGGIAGFQHHMDQVVRGQID